MLWKTKRTLCRALAISAGVLLLARPAVAHRIEPQTVTAADMWQRGPERWPGAPGERVSPEELRKQQEAFITSKAKLTSAEAAYFFPLFRELRKKQRALRHTVRKHLQRVQEARLSEKECDKLLQQVEKLEQQIVDLDQTYRKLWRKKLTATKVMQILAAEHQFSRKVFEHKVR